MPKVNQHVKDYLEEITRNNPDNNKFLTHSNVIALGKLFELNLPSSSKFKFLIEGMTMDSVSHAHRRFFAQELQKAIQKYEESKDVDSIF